MLVFIDGKHSLLYKILSMAQIFFLILTIQSIIWIGKTIETVHH